MRRATTKAIAPFAAHESVIAMPSHEAIAPNAAKEVIIAPIAT